MTTSDSNLRALMQVVEEIRGKDDHCLFQRTTPAGERYCHLLSSLEKPEKYCQHLSGGTVTVLEPSPHRIVSIRVYHKSNFIPRP